MPLSQVGLSENGGWPEEGAPSLSLRSLQGQGGVFDFPEAIDRPTQTKRRPE